MTRLTWCSSIVGLLASATFGAEPLPRIPPKEPAEALKTFVVRDGFEMQLLAAEPLVTDPVAMEYDENGRAYVAEMRDYPYTDKASDKPFVERTKDEPLGRIRLLEDTDGDGRFDKSTIFAEGLSWPTGLALWKGGVYVVATPDLWYLKDTDGDGKADERRKVLTGFRKFNVQAVINNLKWGLDGKIYGAGSSNGGQILSGDKFAAPPVPMTTADFRFDPNNEPRSFELQSGGARFGNSFDDWGNRFICNIRNPIQHVVLPRHYLARNPYWPARSPLQDVAEAGDTIPVFRISPPEPWRVMNARRLANDATVASPRSESVATGYMTSACGLTVYRGSAYPRELYGTIFLAEVAGNLIHHQVLKPNGVTFTSQRSDPQSEFVASTDNWFRPVNFVNAPDGTLHVLDMYRETIEHPWSIPDDIKAQLDLESGRDRGRIYRLCPVGFQPPKPPRLGNATTEQLIEQLQNPNSWWRETAHRLLLERQDKSAVPALRARLRDRRERDVSNRNVTALGRQHALWLLDSLQSLKDADLLVALSDPVAEIRIHAIRLAEPRAPFDSDFRRSLCERADDADIRVRFQAALSLGVLGKLSTGSEAAQSLVRIANRDVEDEFLHTAVLSSSAELAPRILSGLLLTTSQRRDQPASSPDDKPNRGATEEAELRWLRELAFIIGARSHPEGPEEGLVDLGETMSRLPAPEFINNDQQRDRLNRRLREVIIGLYDGLQRAKQSLPKLLDKHDFIGKAQIHLAWEEALQAAGDLATDPNDRRRVLPLLTFVDFDRAASILSPLLQPNQSASLQAVAVRVLAGHRQPDVPKMLFAAYRQLAPAARGEVIEALLSRPEWHVALLDAIDAGAIKPAEIPHIRRNVLVRSTNAAVKERAVAMFRSLLESRQKVVDKYREALPKLNADRVRGEAVFRRECQACHRVNNIGTDVGPNLATIRHRAPEEVLLHILDPNREVGPNFVAYAVELNDGRVLTGMIVEDTASGMTLVLTTGVRETILRSNIDELASTGQSLMPPGLEDRITPQEMTDLLSFLLPGR